MTQNIFRSSYVVELLRKAKKGKINLYKGEKFPINEDMLLVKHDVEEPENIKIVMQGSDSKDKKDFENAVAIYKAYPDLDRTQATDIRFWTYLSHTVYWEYLKKRWPLKKNKELDIKNIVQHWFIDGLSAKNFARHGVSSLWWSTHFTYEEGLEDPFMLTREFYTLAEYKWELLEGTLGRYKHFTKAFLEFVLENNDLFKEHKETRVRFLKKKMNFIGGYSNFGIMDKTEIKQILSGFKQEILEIKKSH
jgi:hypothetical protein